MKIPKKIKVGGIHYKVKLVNQISTGTDYCGLCNESNTTIEILKNYKRHVQEEILLHELLHAIFSHCDLEQDEHLIEVLAQALHMVIKDNPEMFK